MAGGSTTWGMGDYPAMARRLLPVAEVVVEAAAIRPGDRVVDVATGTGNAAVLAAERGARATGIDFEPVLLRLAEQRATEAGLTAEWVLGEVARLPLPDRCADVVLSVLGVMYAPDHEAAAAELSRICDSGGRVVLAAWTPGSVMPSMGRFVGAYLPPPPAGSAPPSRWGDLEAVTSLLATAGPRVTSSRRNAVQLVLSDAAAATDFLLDTAGHVVAEKPRLVHEGRWNALVADVRSFVTEHGHRHDDQFRLALEYLVVDAVHTAGQVS